MSAITEGVLSPHEEEHDPQFEPVIRLTKQVEAKTGEEDEIELYKERARLFRFDSGLNEWKERGTGDARLLKHKESKKVRLVMRRDKTLKVCANHLITSDLNLQPNVGSERSWVWKVAADYSEDPPTSETLAIRLSNSTVAEEFKKAFEDAREANAKLSTKPTPPEESEPVPEPAPTEKSEPPPTKKSEPAPPKESEPTPTEGEEGKKTDTNEEAKEETNE